MFYNSEDNFFSLISMKVELNIHNNNALLLSNFDDTKMICKYNFK